MNTPRTDAWIQTDQCIEDKWSRLLDLSRTLERELSACRRDLAAEELGTANLNRCLDASRAECQRLRALVQDAYDDPDSEILGTEWNNSARAALQEIQP